MDIGFKEVCPMAACKKSAQCYRYEAYLQAEANALHYDMLNPRLLKCGKNGCPYLLIKGRQRMAYGFRKLVAEVKLKDARNLFYLFRFGSQSSYDRRRRGIYPLNPAKQEYVLQKFKTLGVDTSIGFDRYEWQDVLMAVNEKKTPRKSTTYKVF